jgi:signal recognition particle subunit SRP54
VEQLQVVSRQAGVEFFSKTSSTPIEVCKAAISEARQKMLDLTVLDTAGRLHVNEELMAELVAIKKNVKPHEILFVADGMTGQDAVNTAQSFQNRLDLTGVVLTKMDGDARGGAALSIKAVIGKPIKFIGTGEKLDALEKFHPDRIASRILGMGDVVTLVEKAQQAIDQEKVRKLEEKLRKSEFTLEDFLDQLQQVKKMGPLNQLVGMLPGVGARLPKDAEVDEGAIVRTEAIIQSMTPLERQKPQILNGTRRLRIAKGSGTSVQEVNRLIKQFEMMRKMMKQVGRNKRLPF